MNPAIFSIGSFTIRWYSVIMLLAIFIGLYLLKRESDRLNFKYDFIFNMCFWAIIFGYLSARLYYVIFNLDYYSANPGEIFAIWKGGLAIHGGIIGGLLTCALYCYKYKTRLIRYTDMICVPLILGQAIGRWGNFFNSEAHGAATTLEHLQKLHIPQFIIDGMYIDGAYRTPTFLYESFSSLLCFIVLILLRKTKKMHTGQLTGMYLSWYGIERFFIEGLRTDSLMLGNIRIAQLVSLLFLLSGIILIIYSYKKNKKYIDDKIMI